LAAALIATGRLSEAIPHLQEALKLDPTNRDIESNLAQAQARLGHQPD
jgi:Flp pilus assembly protein TadD